MLYVRDLVIGSQPRGQLDTLASMGWWCVADHVGTTTAYLYFPQIFGQSGMARQRWRATNPATRPATTFTRNTDVESSATAGRHIPRSFRGPAAVAAIPPKPTIVSDAVHHAATW